MYSALYFRGMEPFNVSFKPLFDPLFNLFEPTDYYTLCFHYRIELFLLIITILVLVKRENTHNHFIGDDTMKSIVNLLSDGTPRTSSEIMKHVKSDLKKRMKKNTLIKYEDSFYSLN